MNPPVFISYARSTSLEYARKLVKELGASEAFLDESGIESGAVFTETLVDALLDSRVVVVFADETYFRRWYCLRELQAALAPFLELSASASDVEKEAELRPIVIVRPPGESAPDEELRRLPSVLRNTQWRKGDDLAGLTQLVRARLAATPTTLGARLGGARAEVRKQLLEELALPPPRNLAGFQPLYPIQWPSSLGAAFKGRTDELWRMDFTLSTLRGDVASGAASTLAVVGGAGYGKTRLALEYVYRLGPLHYPGGIFWMDADVDEDRLEEQFHGILSTLRPQVPELVAFRQQERNAATELAQALHEVAARKPVLYVVDNIPDAPPRPLRTWCPAVGKVALLVTSKAQQGAEGIHTLLLDTLSPEASVEVLTTEVKGASTSEPEWGQIADQVGHLPLVLTLLNRVLRHGGLTRNEILDLLRQKRAVHELDRHMEALRGQISSESLRGVTEALIVSYERLPEPARKTARYLAHLAPEPVPLALLKELSPEAASPEVRVALITRSFVTEAKRTKQEQVALFGSMHRVLANFLLRQATNPQQELSEVCEAILLLMAADAILEHKNWSLMSACLPHAEKLFEELGHEDGAATRENELYRVWLGLRIGPLLNGRGLLKRARDVAALTLARAREVLEPEHPTTLSALANLAFMLHDLGDYSGARQYAEQVLEVRRRVLGEEHPDTLTSMSNLAVTLNELGNHPEARQYEEQVLKVRRRVLGEEHPDTLTSMSNLAVTLMSMGDFLEARQQEEHALQVSRRVLGDAHPLTIATMANLASALGLTGNHVEARQYEEQVLEAQRRALGEEHPETLLAMANLAVTLNKLGDPSRARQYMEQVLQVRRRVLGEEHPDTLKTMANLGVLLYELGDYSGARGYEEQVLVVRRRVLGEAHPDTLLAVHSLAQTKAAQREASEERTLWGRLRNSLRHVFSRRRQPPRNPTH